MRFISNYPQQVLFTNLCDESKYVNIECENRTLLITRITYINLELEWTFRDNDETIKFIKEEERYKIKYLSSFDYYYNRI